MRFKRVKHSVHSRLISGASAQLAHALEFTLNTDLVGHPRDGARWSGSD
jgi:hypothetical protein